MITVIELYYIGIFVLLAVVALLLAWAWLKRQQKKEIELEENMVTFSGSVGGRVLESKVIDGVTHITKFDLLSFSLIDPKNMVDRDAVMSWNHKTSDEPMKVLTEKETEDLLDEIRDAKYSAIIENGTVDTKGLRIIPEDFILSVEELEDRTYDLKSNLGRSIEEKVGGFAENETIFDRSAIESNKPKGIEPEWMHREDRWVELKQIIEEYKNSNRPIPQRWVDEANVYQQMNNIGINNINNFIIFVASHAVNNIVNQSPFSKTAKMIQRELEQYLLETYEMTKNG